MILTGLLHAGKAEHGKVSFIVRLGKHFKATIPRQRLILNVYFSSLWKATGDYLVSSADACTSQLTLAVTVSRIVSDNDE